MAKLSGQPNTTKTATPLANEIAKFKAGTKNSYLTLEWFRGLASRIRGGNSSILDEIGAETLELVDDQVTQQFSDKTAKAHVRKLKELYGIPLWRIWLDVGVGSRLITSAIRKKMEEAVDSERTQDRSMQDMMRAYQRVIELAYTAMRERMALCPPSDNKPQWDSLVPKDFKEAEKKIPEAVLAASSNPGDEARKDHQPKDSQAISSSPQASSRLLPSDPPAPQSGPTKAIQAVSPSSPSLAQEDTSDPRSSSGQGDNGRPEREIKTGRRNQAMIDDSPSLLEQQHRLALTAYNNDSSLLSRSGKRKRLSSEPPDVQPRRDLLNLFDNKVEQALSTHKRCRRSASPVANYKKSRSQRAHQPYSLPLSTSGKLRSPLRALTALRSSAGPSTLQRTQLLDDLDNASVDAAVSRHSGPQQSFCKNDNISFVEEATVNGRSCDNGAATSNISSPQNLRGNGCASVEAATEEDLDATILSGGIDAEDPRNPKLSQAALRDKLSSTSTGPVRLSLGCLEPGRWVNDEVIQALLELFNTDSRCLIVSSLFVASLTAKDIAKKRLRSLQKHHDILIAPLHLRGNHWGISILRRDHRTVELYEPYQSGHYTEAACDLSIRLAELIDRQLLTADERSAKSSWTVVSVPTALTQQASNFRDCGIYIVAFAICRQQDAEVPATIHVDAWRRALSHSLQDPGVGGSSSIKVDDRVPPPEFVPAMNINQMLSQVERRERSLVERAELASVEASSLTVLGNLADQARRAHALLKTKASFWEGQVRAHTGVLHKSAGNLDEAARDPAINEQISSIQALVQKAELYLAATRPPRFFSSTEGGARDVSLRRLAKFVKEEELRLVERRNKVLSELGGVRKDMKRWAEAWQARLSPDPS